MSMDRFLSGSVSDFITKYPNLTSGYHSLPRHLHPAAPTHDGFSNRDEHWHNLQTAVISLFQKKKIPDMELYNLQEDVKHLLKSEVGPFLFEFYQNQLLKKGMVILREHVKHQTGKELLVDLGELWDFLFTEILPTLQAIFQQLPTTEVSLRHATLKSFRDVVVLKTKLRETLACPDAKMHAATTQMLLVLLSLRDAVSPTENCIRLEKMAAKVINPLLGHGGLYLGASEPAYPSSIGTRDTLAAYGKSKSADNLLDGYNPLTRKISRPASTQILPNPYQAPTMRDTKRQGIMMAIREYDSVRRFSESEAISEDSVSSVSSNQI